MGIAEKIQNRYQNGRGKKEKNSIWEEGIPYGTSSSSSASSNSIETSSKSSLSFYNPVSKRSNT
jgi:hypothetical protein